MAVDVDMVRMQSFRPLMMANVGTVRMQSYRPLMMVNVDTVRMQSFWLLAPVNADNGTKERKNVAAVAVPKTNMPNLSFGRVTTSAKVCTTRHIAALTASNQYPSKASPNPGDMCVAAQS